MVKKGLTDIELGKLPPQAIEIEEAVLGAILLESESLVNVIDLLKPEIFYKDEHQKICQAIIDLEKDHKKIDILTITEQLRKNKTLEEVGGPYYVSKLTSRVSGSYHLEEHLKYVTDNYKFREIIRISTELTNLAYDNSLDIKEIIEFAEKELTQLSSDNIRNKTISIKNSLKEVISDLEKINTNNKSLTGIKSGISCVDRITNGWQNSDLIIIAARPSMGKTGIALKFANISAENNYPTAFFSMEMAHKQLSIRSLAASMNIEPQVLRSKIEDSMWERISYHENKFYNIPLYIDDTPALKIHTLRSKIRRLVRKYDIKIVFIDYIQLMCGDKKNQNREGEISDISRGLKELAKEINIPIVVLSQLNRNLELRAGFKRPMLSDLRESGCLIGDTLIQCPKHKKTYRIEELVYRKKFNIFATNNHKVMEKIANKCFKSGIKKVYELKLLNGQKIQATSNHKFLTSNGWIPLSELHYESVAIPINYNDKKDDVNPFEISLIGHFLAKGSALKGKSIRYCCNINDGDLSNSVMADALIACNNKISPYFVDTILDKSKFRTVFFKPTFHLTHGKHSPMTEIFKKYGLWDVRCKQKFIPDQLFYISHKNTFILLKSLFSGDGTVYYAEKNGRKSLKISYSSASEKLIFGVQQLLAKVGIVSFISEVSNKKNQNWYNLYIAGKSNIEIFVKKIGFINKRKQDILIQGWEKSKNNLAGWNKYQFNEERTLCFIPVKEIKYIGDKEVYDIEVDDLHNFVANNIIVHNSLEQDADIVIFLHRPFKYGFNEYDDIEHTPTKIIRDNEKYEVAELNIAKHRNGKVDLLKIIHNEPMTYFDDYIPMMDKMYKDYSEPFNEF